MKRPRVAAGEGRDSETLFYSKSLLKIVQHYGFSSPKNLPTDGESLLAMWWTVDPEQLPVSHPSKNGYEVLAERLEEAFQGAGYFYTLTLEAPLCGGTHARIYDARTVKAALTVLRNWVGTFPAYLKVEVGFSGRLHGHVLAPLAVRDRPLPRRAKLTYWSPIRSIAGSVSYLVKHGDARLTSKYKDFHRSRDEALRDWLEATLKNQNRGLKNPALSLTLNLPHRKTLCLPNLRGKDKNNPKTPVPIAKIPCQDFLA